MWIRWGIPVLAVACLAYGAIATIQMTPTRVEQPPPSRPPIRALDGETIAAVGLVEPRSEFVAVSVPTPGLIVRVHVAPNAAVRRGDPLFSLDDRDLQAERAWRESRRALTQTRLARLQSLPRPEEVPPARARLAAAQAALGDARVQLELMESVTDPRAIRREELSRRRFAVETAAAQCSQAQAELDLLLAGAWQEDIAIALADVAEARAAVERVAADIERLTIRAPLDGEILKLDAREGEYAAAGPLQRPLIVLGASRPLHVRVDVNEEDAWRMRSGAAAEALLRGNAEVRIPLRFVRLEPYVVPKQSLSGGKTERVDTRVLQAIYEVVGADQNVFVGQQVDVFIAAGPARGAVAGGANDPQ